MRKIHILSRTDEPFADRVEAGQLLGLELEKWCDKKLIVLGVPRGGVVVADEIANILDVDMDIVLSRKLGAPDNPELAVGAIGEKGEVFFNQELIDQLGITLEEVHQEEIRQRRLLEERKMIFRNIYPKLPVKDKTVVICDDGIATGATMQAAIWNIRREGPRRIIVALPVGPQETMIKLSKDADDVFCLHAPAYFSAVGQFYQNFKEVTDQDVLRILNNHLKRKYSHV